MVKTDKFKTVDELVEYMKLTSPDFNRHSYKDVTRYIIQNQILAFKAILMSETNIPSKYDLLIIQAISKDDFTLNSLHNKSWQEIARDILQFYSNRKESSNG